MIIEYSRGIPDSGLFERAWHEYVELQTRSKDVWVAATIDELTVVETYKLYLKQDDVIIGGLILAQDNDIHVGECLTVMFGYVVPEHRSKVGFDLYRLAVRLARRLGYKMLAYTHRLGDWEYVTKYRKLHG